MDRVCDAELPPCQAGCLKWLWAATPITAFCNGLLPPGDVPRWGPVRMLPQAHLATCCPRITLLPHLPTNQPVPGPQMYRDGGIGVLRPAIVRLGGPPVPGICEGLQVRGSSSYLMLADATWCHSAPHHAGCESQASVAPSCRPALPRLAAAAITYPRRPLHAPNTCRLALWA